MTLNEFVKNHNITIKNVSVANNPNMNDKNMNHWKSTLHMNGRQMTIYFSQGFGIKHEPTAKDVVECLHMDDSFADQSFEDFCGELGYNIAQMNSRRIYRAILRNSKKFRQFIGESLEELNQCEYD